MQAIFWSVFNAGEQVSIIFLDSQIFDQVLDIFPWLSYWFTFIMLNVGMVDNLEFWYTINFFTLPSFTQTLQSRVITFFLH